MKTYTIQFKDNLIKNKTRFICTDEEAVVEYYVSKYWEKDIKNLKVTNEISNVRYDYDKIPALRQIRERA